jgi:hypothetical protein
MCDFSIQYQFVKILCPMGFMYLLERNGHVIEKTRLDGEVPNYQSFIAIDNDKTLFWSLAPDDKTLQLHLYSKERKEFINSYYKDHPVLDITAKDAFYSFQETEAFGSRVE